MMNEDFIRRLSLQCFETPPLNIKRAGIGIANYVYIAEYDTEKRVIRCSRTPDAYRETVYWLQRLKEINISVPIVMEQGKFEGYEYLILSFMEGCDLGLVYDRLTNEDKREIAKEIVRIQQQVSALSLPSGYVENDWSWKKAFIDDSITQAETRIERNGFFDAEKAKNLKNLATELNGYFSRIRPTAYLDDVSNKNLLIKDGRISGIIDIDRIGIGDKLTYVALTRMALLDMESDTDFVDYIVEEMELEEEGKKALLFYTLI